jgi:methionyl-tRNA formyltransferase
MAVRIVFLGSKPIGYQCLQYLLEKSNALDAEVVGVRTRVRKEFSGANDLATLAARHGIPLLNSLDEMPECDIIYSVQHHELLKREHIEKASRIAVNLHLAPLPEYRGCNQFSFAIMDKATEFGVTLHAIDTLIDHGDVLFEQRFSVPDDCWVNELYELTFSAGLSLFRESLKPLLEGNYNRVPQAELRKERTSSLHFREEINTLKQIDLTQDKATIERTIRATYMPGFEPPYILVNGKKVHLELEA